MQNEITRLLNYFQGIHTIIEDVCGHQCERFLNTIKDGMDQSISDQQAIVTSLSEMQAQVSTGTSPLDAISTKAIPMRSKDVFVKLLSLRGHFAVINDNAQFYSQISQAHIIPAIDEVGALPIASTSKDVRTGAADLLTKRTIESAIAIQKIGADVRSPCPLPLHRDWCASSPTNIPCREWTLQCRTCSEKSKRLKAI